MNVGCMPRTDFTYEEFEGLLASYYLSLMPLRDSGDPIDKEDFEAAVTILDGFAERYDVQKPAEAVAHPRKTTEPWGQPKVFETCFTLLDMMSSFWRDFGVGADPKELDGQERHQLGRLLLSILHRRKIIRAKFSFINDKLVAVSLESWAPGKQFQPFA